MIVSVVIIVALPFRQSWLVQANSIGVVPSAHVREDDGVALLQSFKYLDAVDRSASNFDRDSHGCLAIGAQFEQADRAVFVAERGTAYVKHVRHPVEIDGSIDAQVGTRAQWHGPRKLYVNRDRSVHYGEINSHYFAFDHAVVGIDLGWLPDLDVARLGLGDLQCSLQLIRLYHLRQHCPGIHMLPYLQRHVRGLQHSVDSRADRQRLFLPLFQRQHGLGLLHLGLLDSNHGSDGPLIHLELLPFNLLPFAHLVGLAP